MMEQVSAVRQVAMKVRLSDLTDGKYVRVEGQWEPNFIQTSDGRKFSRVNIIAVVASEPVPDMNFNSFIIDDGTARVPVRIFGESDVKVKLGDVVLVIGRPREFNQQVYIVPEIIKEIRNNKWIEYRKLELRHLPASMKAEPAEQAPAQADQTALHEDIQESGDEAGTEDKDKEHPEIAKEKTKDEMNPVDMILEKISELDKGDGADTDEVISSLGIPEAEKIIENLLKEGEVFEISSGRIKVLE
jgi:hypothetical protein